MSDAARCAAELERFLLARLATLRPGSTMCPGRLARDAGHLLADIRPLLAQLADQGAIRTTQRGVDVDLAQARGPFRVSLRRAAAGLQTQEEPQAQGNPPA